jgi:hypothetical protein
MNYEERASFQGEKSCRDLRVAFRSHVLALAWTDSVIRLIGRCVMEKKYHNVAFGPLSEEKCTVL